MIAPRETGDQGLSSLQQPHHHANRIPEKTAVARLPHERGGDCAVQPYDLAGLDTFSCRALASRTRLIASHVSARMALMVLCSTDFFGVNDSGSRAKARNEAEF